jgi:phage replication-related protein YjqB (UPF0714/DUF867 family)
VRRSLHAAGFDVGSDPSYGGNLADNIVNRTHASAGVHIEVTNALRRLMFDGGLDRFSRQRPTATFHRFVAAVRDALDEEAGAGGSACPSPHGSDLYGCFGELFAENTEGVDYTRTFRATGDPVLVLAPHGGGIEPGSSEVADAIAGSRFGFYEFAGVRSSGNYGLHITSTNYDEPTALEMVGAAEHAIAVHGTAGSVPLVYVDGLDRDLVALIDGNLRAAGFSTSPAPPEMAAQVESNLVNRTATGAGVQLELSAALRRQMFDGGLDRASRQRPTATFYGFVAAVQTAMYDHVPGDDDEVVTPPEPSCPAPWGNDRYGCFEELAAANAEGVDYAITSRAGGSGLLVLSPHGGGIEPGSSELADAIAGYDHGRYDFSGVRSVGNRDLHLSVLNFDEPEAMRLQATATRSVALHGAAGSTPRVLVDGLDAGTVAAVRRSLTAAGFTVASDPSYGGNLEGNIVNRNASGAGVHIEVTSGLRQEMFDGGLDRAARQHPTPVFDLFVAAVRDAL